MVEPTNLRKERKKRNRKEKSRQAADNRLKFGRTREERDQAATLIDRANKKLDRHLLNDKGN